MDRSSSLCVVTNTHMKKSCQVNSWDAVSARLPSWWQELLNR